MSFESVLHAASELLRRRKRVTLSLLRREFALDAESLADLKDQLVLAERVAREEDGQILVWIGEEPPRGPALSAPAVATPAPLAAQPAAERRNLTVMFCDLVGSTKLAARLDPEDLRDLVKRYHEACVEVLRPAGGHVAQYLGDGVLVYFGFPVAHEDDAERAVRAGLAITAAVRRLGQAMAQRVPEGLSARVGIHSGLVVVGELGAASGTGALALGEAPNVAAHIQSMAQPGTVLVSQATLDLLPPRFFIEPLGPVVLKDPARPIHLARVLAATATPAGTRRPPLVDPTGRLQLLREAWQQALTGGSSPQLLLGEPGLGKTTLTDALVDEAASLGATVRVLRCSAFQSQSTLHPVAQHLLHRAGLNPDDPGDEAGERVQQLLRDDGVDDPLLPALVALLLGTSPGAAAPPPAVLMQRLQGLLVEWLAAATHAGAALVVWEDAHWADPTSLAVLRRLLEGPPVPWLMTLISARPPFAPPWRTDAMRPPLQLQRMDDAAIRALVLRAAAGRPLAPPLVDRIVATAEGVPLYAEQIARSVTESAGRAAVIDVPPTLQASLTARLDRLGAAKSVAQTAALLGRDFSVELLGAVTGLAEAELDTAIGQLVDGDVLQALEGPGPRRLSFRHALLQAAASDTMLRTARRGAHEWIATVLRDRFPAVVELAPEVLAGHWTEAGRTDDALAQWRRAGERALGRSAVAEAAAHLRAGLALLPALPAGRQRDALELGLLIPLASALRAGLGVAAPDTGAAYERASALAELLGDRRQLVPALNGLYSYLLVGGRFAAASGPAERLLEAASANGDELFEMIGLRAVGAVAFHVGEPLKARDHLERGLAMYDAERHAPLALVLGIDHRVMSSSFLGLTLWVLGEDAAARDLLQRNLAWAEALDHGHSQAQALTFGATLLTMLEDWQDAAAMAERGAALSQRLGFPVLAAACDFFGAHARARQGGDAARAAGPMRQAAERVWATGALNYRPLMELLLARVHAAAGDAPAAGALLASAFATVEQSGERWFEPELWRFRGELWPAHRADDLRRARDLARHQRAGGLLRRAEATLAAHEADSSAGALRPGG